ncbi:hydrolase 76 protein [Phlyctochytrium planicorne]|nr:hydrolase 76 protein [Phlyctochytrium planicorne]
MGIKNILAVAAIAVSQAFAAAPLDVKDAASIGKALRAAMPFMTKYWSDGGDESGQYWNAFIDFKAVLGDNTYDDFFLPKFITAAYGTEGDFLGGSQRSREEKTNGKWNDDIAWWAMTALSYAENFGIDKPLDASQPNGPTWYSVAQKTLDEMLEPDQWNNICGGGIYWSRNRVSATPSQKAYKSSISNIQAIQMAARLYALKPDPKQIEVVDRFYGWLSKGPLMSDTLEIYDGVAAYNETTCSGDFITYLQFSYHPSTMMAAFAYLYTATKEDKYLKLAVDHFNGLYTRFVTKDATEGYNSQPKRIPGELWEPACEISPKAKCKAPAGFMYGTYRAIAQTYQLIASKSEDVRKKSEEMIETAAKAVAGRCGSDWNCVRVLNPIPDLGPNSPTYTLPDGTNPRDQFDAVMILNALAAIRKYAPVQTTTVNFGTATPVTTAAGKNNGAFAVAPVGALTVVLAALAGLGAFL